MTLPIDLTGQQFGITIHTRDGGPKKIKATYVTGDFAAHRTSVRNPEGLLADCWTVTHVPTGLAISHYCQSDAAARDFADEVQRLFTEYGVDSGFKDKQFMKDQKELRDVLVARRDAIEREHFASLPLQDES